MERAVLLQIALQVGTAWGEVPHKQVAGCLGVSRFTVHRAAKHLAELGLLLRARYVPGLGSSKGWWYRLNIGTD